MNPSWTSARPIVETSSSERRSAVTARTPPRPRPRAPPRRSARPRARVPSSSRSSRRTPSRPRAARRAPHPRARGPRAIRRRSPSARRRGAVRSGARALDQSGRGVGARELLGSCARRGSSEACVGRTRTTSQPADVPSGRRRSPALQEQRERGEACRAAIAAYARSRTRSRRCRSPSTAPKGARRAAGSGRAPDESDHDAPAVLVGDTIRAMNAAHSVTVNAR